jgi:hypothetical protein
MSKITVKHYLEKKVKSKIIYDNLVAFPLYYRITYQRKTTNIKSFTGALMTEKAYEIFNETNEVYNYETNILKNINLNLSAELFFIENALHEIIKEDADSDPFDTDFTEKIKTYFEDLKESLLFQGWYSHKPSLQISSFNKSKNKTYTVEDILNQKIVLTPADIDFNSRYEKLDQLSGFYQSNFYNSFNKENTLLQNLIFIKEVTNFDLLPFIHSDTIKFWQVIHLILLTYEKTIFIDFLTNYNTDRIIETNKKVDYSVSNDEIVKVCEKLVNNHLGIYIK